MHDCYGVIWVKEDARNFRVIGYDLAQRESASISMWDEMEESAESGTAEQEDACRRPYVQLLGVTVLFWPTRSTTSWKLCYSYGTFLEHCFCQSRLFPEFFCVLGIVP